MHDGLAPGDNERKADGNQKNAFPERLLCRVRFLLRMLSGIDDQVNDVDDKGDEQNQGGNPSDDAMLAAVP